jgi:hypothetical protein
MSEQYLLPFFDEPAPQDTPHTIVCDDVLAWAETYTGPKFHAMLCDPPYHLTSMVARFGETSLTRETHVQINRGNPPGEINGAFARLATGFMGQHWDGGDLAFKPETWEALAQHLLPGAFGMCFASSRGWHRLAVAIEDAGLIIHPSIFGWGFGSGFPKASRIDSQIDHAVGAEREKFIRNRHPGRNAPQFNSNRNYQDTYGSYDGAVWDSAPATPLAQAWAGHRYGLQALKPSLEPIIVFQVPYGKTKPVQSMVTHGAGALWIDGGRLPGTVQATAGGVGGYNGSAPTAEYVHGTGALYQSQGRWPANFCLQHLSLPVVRLNAQLPPDTQDAITRYYAGYTEVTTLRAGRNGAVHDGLEVLARDVPEGWRDYFEVTGEDLGCVRVGERQIDGNRWGKSPVITTQESNGYSHTPNHSHTRAYHDANGNETVAAFSCAPNCPVAALDAQAGERKSGGSPDNKTVYQKGSLGIYGDFPAMPTNSISDSGGASRFFHVSDWSLDIAERLAQADPVYYAAKSSSSERSKGLDGVVQLRSDLSADEKARVLAELQRLGVHPLG